MRLKIEMKKTKKGIVHESKMKGTNGELITGITIAVHRLMLQLSKDKEEYEAIKNLFIKVIEKIGYDETVKDKGGCKE